MLDNNKAWFESLILEQEEILLKNKEFFSSAPDGRLKVRSCKGNKIFRQVTTIDGKTKEKTLPDNSRIVDQLIRKELSRITIARCESNIEILKKAAERYKSLDGNLILGELNKHYTKIAGERLPVIAGTAAGAEGGGNIRYRRRNDKDGLCIHETLRGDLVASKSEVIIANALYASEIPYLYDCQINVVNENGYYYYVDFLIPLPDREYIYWEHMGLLNNSDYVARSIRKIRDYHNKGICLGRNFFITVDDENGNCSSREIYNIVKNFIKPQFVCK